MVKVAIATLFLGCFSVATALAQVNGSGARSAPEIDGPGGVAAIALLVSAGLIAFNRFRKK